MPNALIYSPIFDGHRQMYVFVLSNVLKELGFKVFIAGNIHAQSDSNTHIEKIKADDSVQFIDTSIYKMGGLEISRVEFFELQTRLKVDFTVFAEADHHIKLFIDQIPVKNKKLIGRVTGIFLRPFYLYEKHTFIESLKYIKHLPSIWKNDERVFFEFFLKYFPLLDSVLCIDENFVSKHSYSQWLPDVFQKFTENIFKIESNPSIAWLTRLDNFKKQNNGRFVFLYFGTAQNRRGYDTLLKMTVENEGCFLHCGLRGNETKFSENVDQLRSKLQSEGRFLETNEFIENPAIIEAFFKMTTHIILPYRRFYGSSGVMIQALGYGIPVLVPENGIMGHRVKKHKLGLVFDNKNPESLKKRFQQFIKLSPSHFNDGISTFLEFQNTEILKHSLESAITGNIIPINLP